MTAHCLARGEFEDLNLRLVCSLVGEASDRQWFNKKWGHSETTDRRDAIQVASVIDPEGYIAVLHRAEGEAASFVRMHEDAIKAVGRFLYREGTLSGLEVRLMMDKHPPRTLHGDDDPGLADGVLVRRDGYMVAPVTNGPTVNPTARSIAASGVVDHYDGFEIDERPDLIQRAVRFWERGEL
jgi:hypothetical protein